MTMTKETKIPGTDEAWDSGELGRDEQYVGVIKDDQDSAIDDALELKQVSIRLQKSLIEDFKIIAKLNGIGYQPLMRRVPTLFALSEKKKLFNQMMAEIEECAEKEKLASAKPDKKIA